VLSDLSVLWCNRERPSSVRRLVVLLIKRLLMLAPLSAIMARNAHLRWRGATIGHLVIFNCRKISGAFGNLSVGSESSVGKCEICLHEKVEIGSRVVINDGAILLTATHSLSDPAWGTLRAPIVIRDYAWIATRAIILPGSDVGRGAVVGAGAVVNGTVPDYCVVSGNPAGPHSARRIESLNYSPVMMNAPFQAWVGRNGATPT
jgi:maltose O-acetyltransferase